NSSDRPSDGGGDQARGDDHRRRGRLRGGSGRGGPRGQDEPRVHRGRGVARVSRGQAASRRRSARRSPRVMKKPIFAANWKMHLGPTDANAFLRTFLAHYARRPDRTVIVFPPAATVTTVVDALRERTDILVGVQNIYWEDKGAFTGEVSAGIARDAGARYTLV